MSRLVLNGHPKDLEDFTDEEINKLEVGDIVATTFWHNEDNEILCGYIVKFNITSGTVNIGDEDWREYDIPYDRLKKFPNIKYGDKQ